MAHRKKTYVLYVFPKISTEFPHVYTTSHTLHSCQSLIFLLISLLSHIFNFCFWTYCQSSYPLVYLQNELTVLYFCIQYITWFLSLLCILSKEYHVKKSLCEFMTVVFMNVVRLETIFTMTIRYLIYLSQFFTIIIIFFLNKYPFHSVQICNSHHYTINSSLYKLTKLVWENYTKLCNIMCSFFQQNQILK